MEGKGLRPKRILKAILYVLSSICRSLFNGRVVKGREANDEEMEWKRA